jgi:8-oxo-dGTP pyrophosphatase MutT (NUDIX family)
MWPEEQNKLVTAVQRCNSYNAKEYVPVVVGPEQVGWTPVRMISDLAHQLARGEAAELVLLKKDSREGEEAPADQRVALDIPGQSVAIRLAPYASNGQERCDTVQALVEDLLEDGVIPRKAVRNERQEVRPLYFGFGGPGAPPPLLQMERAAMVHFGCPVFAIHVNGYVRGDDGRIESVWIGQRSMSKATYPGLLDQVVAGGQPAGLSFLENVQKECEEEASLPPEVIATIEHTGVISYKYATRKGLSTKSIAVFDLEFPKGMSPICGDGEVEEFQLMRIEDALASIRHKLPLWKPNAALIMVDFALRHGFIGEDEPGYAEMTELLRRG